MNKSNFLNIITAVTTLAIQYAVSFMISPLIVDSLGEAANGYTQLANNFVSYAALISLALNSMAGRFMAVSYYKKDMAKMNRYYSSIGFCNLLFAAVLLPVSVLFVVHLESLIVVQEELYFDVKILFSCVWINFLLSLMASFFSTTLFVLNKIYIQNMINTVVNILRAAMLVCLFYRFPARVFYVSLTAAVLTLLSIPVYLFYKKKYIPMLHLKWKDFNWNSVSELVKSGIWNTINQCGHMLMTGLDLLLANLFISPSSMGVLSVAKTMPNALTALVSSINGSFTASLTGTWAKGDKHEFIRELRSSMKVSSVLLSIPIMAFTMFSVPFYKLWMPGLDGKLLAILSFLSCIQYIPWTGPSALYNVFTATNHLKVNSIAFLLSGFLNVIVVYFCLKTSGMGIYAVAGVSCGITIIRNLILTVPYTAHILQIRWYSFYKDVGMSLLCCGIVMAVCLAVQKILHTDTWFHLIFAAMVSCVTALLIQFFVILDKNERMRIRKTLMKHFYRRNN